MIPSPCGNDSEPAATAEISGADSSHCGVYVGKLEHDSLLQQLYQQPLTCHIVLSQKQHTHWVKVILKGEGHLIIEMTLKG